MLREISSKSITIKLFMILFMMMFFLSAVVGVIIIKDTNDIMQKETYRMNEQVLSEIGNNVSILLGNIENIVDDIAIDNKIIDILSLTEAQVKNSKTEDIKRMNEYVQGQLLDKIFSNYKSNMRPELYVVGENGLTYSTYSKTKYDIEGIKKEGLYDKIVNSKDEIVLINTYEDKYGIGPYRYIFKMGKVIKDLITGEVKGVLIIHISENMLYDRYQKILSNGSNIYIVDSNGMIISSKDKRDIGKNYANTIDNIHGDIIIKDNTSFMKMTSKIKEFGWSIIEELPLTIIKQPATEIRKRIISIILIVITITIAINYKFSIWVTKPILNIKDKMLEVKNGNLKVEIVGERNDEIGELEESFNSMVKKLDYYIDEIKNTEKQKRLAELSFLQAQINPHFLYNTLSGIRFLISMGKVEEAEEMTYKFTKLLRTILPKASELISLEEEIENIKNYVDLQKMRYKDCFTFSCDIEKEISNLKVPAFILQPIVENAILYSMEKENNKGVVSIVGYKSDDAIKIVIKDNGIGMSQNKVDKALNKDASINGVGVINVHERIQLNYGEKYGLKISSVEGKGTKVIFILPS